jgi:hypothetical protein
MHDVRMKRHLKELVHVLSILGSDASSESALYEPWSMILHSLADMTGTEHTFLTVAPQYKIYGKFNNSSSSFYCTPTETDIV